MPRGIDSARDPRRQPPRYTVPSFSEREPGALLPREGRPATIEQGMETRAWKYLGKRDDDED